MIPSPAARTLLATLATLAMLATPATPAGPAPPAPDPPDGGRPAAAQRWGGAPWHAAPAPPPGTARPPDDADPPPGVPPHDPVVPDGRGAPGVPPHDPVVPDGWGAPDAPDAAAPPLTVACAGAPPPVCAQATPDRVRRLAALIDRLAQRLRAPPRPLHVDLTGPLPGGAAGMLGIDGRIRIDAQRTPPADPRFVALVIHEAAHALLRASARRPLPRGVEEGIVHALMSDLTGDVADWTPARMRPTRAAIDAWPARVADRAAYGDAAQVGACLLALLEARAAGARPWQDAGPPLDLDALARTVGLESGADLLLIAALGALDAPPDDAPACAPPRPVGPIMLTPPDGRRRLLHQRQPLLIGPVVGPALLVAQPDEVVRIGPPPRSDGAPVWWSGAPTHARVVAAWRVDLTRAHAARVELEAWDRSDPQAATVTLTITAADGRNAPAAAPWPRGAPPTTPGAVADAWTPTTLDLTPWRGQVVTVTVTLESGDHRPGHGLALAAPALVWRAADGAWRRDPLSPPQGGGVTLHGDVTAQRWRAAGVLAQGATMTTVAPETEGAGVVRLRVPDGAWGALVLVPDAAPAVGPAGVTAWAAALPRMAQDAPPPPAAR